MAAHRSLYDRADALFFRGRCALHLPDVAESRLGALTSVRRLYADHCDDDAVYPAIEALMVVLCDLVEPAIEAAERAESVGGGS